MLGQYTDREQFYLFASPFVKGTHIYDPNAALL